jgi:hypothetical protein
MLIVKAGNEASYQNVMEALDETIINDVRKYTILPATTKEIAWMKAQQQP